MGSHAQKSIINQEKFIYVFVQAHDDVDITTCVSIFMETAYRQQAGLATEKGSNVLPVRNLVISMFEGFRNRNEVNVLMSSTKKQTHKLLLKIIEAIFTKYDEDRERRRLATVIDGDKTTFKYLF